MRRKWISALLSAIIPGAGQIYNGDYVRGFILVFVATLTFSLGGITTFTTALGVLIWVMGIVDAYRGQVARKTI